jgi:hypothetical protein
MTHEEKVKYMRIATGMCGYGMKDEHVDLLVSLYELTLKKGGKSTIEDIVKEEFAAKDRAKEREIERRKRQENKD